VAAYSRTGHLIYQTSPIAGGLWALPFSIKEMRVMGEPFPIAQRAGSASVSDDGTLAYIDLGEAPGSQFAWYDREGRRLESFGRRDGDMYRPELSPDARRVAVSSRGQSSDVWVTDIALETSVRLNGAPAVAGRFGVWSPRGDEVAFVMMKEGHFSIAIRSADGSRDPRQVKAIATDGIIYDWSPDGRHVAYAGEGGIWIADASGEADPFVFLRSESDLDYAQFSPDGRYLAYCSRESGEWDVLIASFPDREVRQVVSSGGGRHPRWSPNGAELFYVTPQRELMAVPVSLKPELSIGRATRLFRNSTLGRSQWHYDVHPDGRRFLLIEPSSAADVDSKPPSIHVVENWFEEFRGREKN
jgi:Tol biopolymer transport system component